jgi:hypothetical protein
MPADSLFQRPSAGEYFLQAVTHGPCSTVPSSDPIRSRRGARKGTEASYVGRPAKKLIE